jgi:hypothetical protein
MRYILTFILIIILQSCNAKTDFKIDGLRIMKIHLNINKFIVFSGNQTDTIDLTVFKGHEFIDPVINNAKSDFYLHEYWKNNDLKSYYHQIIKLDFKGNIIDTIYRALDNEDITSYMLSTNDNLLVIRSNDYHEWLKSSRSDITMFTPPFDSTKYQIDYKIINVATKEIVKQFNLESTFSIPDFNENSWAPNSDKILVTSKDINSYPDRKTDKIYIYDLSANFFTLVDTGYNAIWCPIDENRIAYQKEKNLFLYNIEKNSRILIKTLGEKENIREIRWTPDGKYIYYNYCRQRLCNKLFGDIVCYPRNAYAQVIDLDNKTVFKRIKGHFCVNTWKY